MQRPLSQQQGSNSQAAVGQQDEDGKMYQRGCLLTRPGWVGLYINADSAALHSACHTPAWSAQSPLLSC